MKIAYITTYKPRECGIATFTNSIVQPLQEKEKEKNAEQLIIAMNEPGEKYDYPAEVRFVIREDQLNDYHEAADFLNEHADVCILQHEFNIFGGDYGLYILPLMNKLTIPSIVVFHTVLRKPTVSQKLVMKELSEIADRVLMISKTAAEFGRSVYEIPSRKIKIINHGVPRITESESAAKKKLSMEGKKVILTFGLITRNKGIETVIRAMPKVVSSHPNVVYLVPGKTHPTILRASGEEYREYLEALTRKLDVEANVQFNNKFLSDEEINEYLAASDILVTPYLHREQVSSGPLTFAMGAQTAVVSTPYWYAEELLADGRGLLFDFKDHGQLAGLINDLLDDPNRLEKLKENSWAFGKKILWSKMADEYLELARDVVKHQKTDTQTEKQHSDFSVPEISLRHIERLTDHTGIIRYSQFAFPEYSSGYSIEDNARSLLALAMLYDLNSHPNVPELMDRNLSFIQFMQRKDGSFRNLMNYDRTFPDEPDSEEAFGRTVRALGYLIGHAPEYIYLEMATSLFNQSAEKFKDLKTLQGVANALIGVCHYLEYWKIDQNMLEKLMMLLSEMMEQYQQNSSDDWPWFEEELRHDNAVLPLALLHASEFSDDEGVRTTALESLRFLTSLTLSEGYLSLIGNRFRYRKGGRRAYFAQQPVDATSMVLLFKKAWQLTGNKKYYDNMQVCFNWFLGDNDLRISLFDPVSHGCCDGLESHGLNRNQGSESSLGLLMAQVAVKDAELSAGSSSENNIMKPAKHAH